MRSRIISDLSQGSRIPIILRSSPHVNHNHVAAKKLLQLPLPSSRREEKSLTFSRAFAFHYGQKPRFRIEIAVATCAEPRRIQSSLASGRGKTGSFSAQFARDYDRDGAYGGAFIRRLMVGIR